MRHTVRVNRVTQFAQNVSGNKYDNVLDESMPYNQL